MGRKFIDCRQFPSEMNCTVAISADNEAELIEAAVQHAVAVHKHQDTPELREQIKGLFKDGTPPCSLTRLGDGDRGGFGRPVFLKRSPSGIEQ